MESTSLTKAMIRIVRHSGGRRPGRLAPSARPTGPSVGLAFIDPGEQHGPEVAGTGRRLGVGRLARSGRGRVHAPRGRSLPPGGRPLRSNKHGVGHCGRSRWGPSLQDQLALSRFAPGNAVDAKRP